MDLKKITGLLVCFLFAVFSFAQQANIDSLMKKVQEAQMKAEKILNDPNVKKIVNNPTAINQDSLLPKNKPQSKKPYQPPQLPAPDNKMLAAIPSKTFSEAELKAYLNDLRLQIEKKVSPTDLSNTQKNAALLNHDAVLMSTAAALMWFKGSAAGALLLAAEAAASAPGNDLAVTNLGGMLNMSGLEHIAMPILRAEVRKNPGNVAAINNMGQCFLGLGLADSAIYYLTRCVKLAPNHTEANNSLGQIYEARNNKAKAMECYERSIRAAFQPAISTRMLRIDPEYRFSKIVKPRVKVPVYFNPDKYQLPDHCRNVDDEEKVKAEYAAFKRMIKSVLDKYDRISKENDKQIDKGIANAVEKLKKQQAFLRRHTALGGVMFGELIKDYSTDVVPLLRYNNEFEKKRDELKKKYEAEVVSAMEKFKDREEKIGENNFDKTLDKEECDEKRKIASKYYLQFASLYHDWQQKNLLHENSLNERIFWVYLIGTDENSALSQVYGQIIGYLNMLMSVSQTMILEVCDENEELNDEINDPGSKEVKCENSIEIPLQGPGEIGAKITADCEKLEIEINGAILVGNFEFGFNGRPTTLAFGAGTPVFEIPEVLGFKAFEFGTKEQFFISFGGRKETWDAGIKWETEFDIKGMASPEIKAGWTLGINSGWQFQEGPFKPLLDKLFEIKEDPQLNKNVKKYQPPAKTN